MSGGIIANVRLVKCPKCSRVLPELADVPVYKCGGCGAVLQAKNRKTKIEDTNSGLSESALPHTGDLGHTSVDTNPSSPSQNGNHIPATGDSRDQCNYYSENNSADCVTETEVGNISNEHCVDDEVLATDEGDSGQNEHDNTRDFEGRSKDEMHMSRARRLFLSTNLPNESPSPANQATYGLDHTVDSPSSFSCSDSEKLPFNCRTDSTVAVDTLCSDAVQCQSKEEVQDSQENVNHEDVSNYGNSDVGSDELLMKRKSIPIVATGSTHHLNSSRPLKGLYGGPDSVNQRASTSSSPVSEELHSTTAKSLSPKEDSSAYEISYSDVIQSRSRRKAGHPQKSFPNGYDIVNPLEATELSSSELSGTVRKLSISATTKSGHGYDGSISSYEDQDDQIYKQTFRDVNYFENDGKKNFNINKVASITAVQQQAREFFSSEKNHKTTQESSWSPTESGDLMRYQIRNQIGLEAEIYPENGGPNSYRLEGGQSDSSIYSADKLPYTEKERVELLKMVYELKEEINRTPTNTVNSDGRNPSQFWNGRQMPVRPHARRDFMDEVDLQSKYSRYPFTSSEQRTNWPHQQNRSWVPFSGEVANHHRHHDGYSCQHRQPVDRHFSAQLAPSVCSLNTGQSVHLHSGDPFRNPYSSSTSSPRRYMESDFPSRVQGVTYDDQRLMESDFPSRVRDLTYDDQRFMERYVEASLVNSSIATDHALKDEMKKFQAREKQPRVRLHIRPIAGGAPFITCYQCWSLLQLPADSFLFRRRFHKLKCGSCSKMLKFSLENRTCIVPYLHDYSAPPPNEVKGRRSPVNLRNISPHSHGIPMPCSDHQLGNSFRRSFSTTEGKQEFLAASSAHALQAINGGNKNSSSSDILKGKKKRPSKQLFSKDKGPGDIAGSSSTNPTFNIENYSSESREPKSRTGSPLHRLMGYTSISQVFRGPSKGTCESFRNKSAR